MQNEQQIVLPKDDYQWFVDDTSWVEASDGKLRWHELSRMKSLLFKECADEDMWVDFLKSDDRLSHLLLMTRMPEEYINYEFYEYQWSDLFCEYWGIGSAFWADPTPFELMISETVRALNAKWWAVEKYGHYWEEQEAVLTHFDLLEEYVKKHEKTQFRVAPYFPTDYHLFETDDEWVSASPESLRSHYLDVLKKSVGESSWIGFLKRPDRLQHIIRYGDPRLEQRTILKGGMYQWEDLASPVWGLGSKVWPDPTPHEIEQVRELFATYQEWGDAGENVTLFLSEHPQSL